MRLKAQRDFRQLPPENQMQLVEAAINHLKMLHKELPPVVTQLSLAIASFAVHLTGFGPMTY